MHPTPSQGMDVVARRQACAAVAKRADGVGCGGQMQASVIGLNTPWKAHSSRGGKKRNQKVPTAMRLSRPQLHPTPSQGTGVVARRQACAAVAKRLENGPKTKQRNPIYHCTESFQPFLHFDLVKPTVAARCDTLTPRPLSSILSKS